MGDFSCPEFAAARDSGRPGVRLLRDFSCPEFAAARDFGRPVLLRGNRIHSRGGSLTWAADISATGFSAAADSPAAAGFRATAVSPATAGSSAAVVPKTVDLRRCAAGRSLSNVCHGARQLKSQERQSCGGLPLLFQRVISGRAIPAADVSVTPVPARRDPLPSRNRRRCSSSRYGRCR